LWGEFVWAHLLRALAAGLTDHKHRWRRPAFASASGQRDWPVAASRRADRDAGWSAKLHAALQPLLAGPR
jgi:hypothetical protein